MTKEGIIQKVVLPALTTGVMALTGWVWNSQQEIGAMAMQLDHAESAISKLESANNNTKVALLERDIEHIEQRLEEIKTLVVKLARTP